MQPPFNRLSDLPPNRRPILWSVFAAVAVAGIGLFFIPAYIIQPFKYQAPLALKWAMALRQRAPWGTLAAFALCLILASVLWRDSLGAGGKWRNRGRKTGLALVMVLVAFSTVMSRLNYFEWMFHPVGDPRFEAEAQSKLDGKEMILAVRYGADARAYPISQMAYHHIVNDVVGGVPIAVTY